ncbi:hypothetical protein, variant [Aphanomyces astaci]|nr:hypothetical protein, variant [Aphanomyces astaci]ETV78609.1 hypothetical protein, variant [Aphanomyces astaci]|eukprot:XP_009832189.1 hypothetical protein, variant [Aphanomyces astaci]
MLLHPPTTTPPRQFKLQRIVLAWVHWRRNHHNDRRRCRIQVHAPDYATKASVASTIMCAGNAGEDRKHADIATKERIWREKYIDDDLTLLDANNDTHYSRNQLKPQPTKPRYVIPPPKVNGTSLTNKPPGLRPPPPKAPKFSPPELIQVDNYTIDLGDTPPSVASHASDAAKALQGQVKQSQADQVAVSRRKRNLHKHLILQDNSTSTDIGTASAAKIQRWYRRLRRDRRLHMERDAAATLINLCIRRYLSRKQHVHDLGRGRATHAAATLLQSQRATDAKLALQMERRRKKARRRIDEFLSKNVVPHLNRRFHAILRVQAFWRRCLCQKAYHRTRRSRALLTIQCAWRQALARRAVTMKRELKAVAVLQRHIRGRYIRRVVLVERKRVAMMETVLALHVIAIDDPATASTGHVLSSLGLYYYGIGQWWAAAASLERACRNGLVRDVPTTAALAYCHHQTWHASYDRFNLTRAHDLYATIVPATPHDPYVLHDYAIVLLERAEYKAGLDVLAHVLAVFPQFQLASTAMLWVAVVLLHLGRGDESIAYFGCLLDTPPSPFTATDMTVLCAVGYGRSHNVEASKQGMQTALAACQGASRTKLTKADMLADLAKRATSLGHYLMAYVVYFYALHRFKTSKADTWFCFADTLRHLGRADEALQALAVAAQLDPAHSLVQTTLGSWPHLPRDAFLHELHHTIDLEFVRHLKHSNL